MAGTTVDQTNPAEVSVPLNTDGTVNWPALAQMAADPKLAATGAAANLIKLGTQIDNQVKAKAAQSNQNKPKTSTAAPGDTILSTDPNGQVSVVGSVPAKQTVTSVDAGSAQLGLNPDGTIAWKITKDMTPAEQVSAITAQANAITQRLSAEVAAGTLSEDQRQHTFDNMQKQFEDQVGVLASRVAIQKQLDTQLQNRATYQQGANSDATTSADNLMSAYNNFENHAVSPSFAGDAAKLAAWNGQGAPPMVPAGDFVTNQPNPAAIQALGRAQALAAFAKASPYQGPAATMLPSQNTQIGALGNQIAALGAPALPQQQPATAAPTTPAASSVLQPAVQPASVGTDPFSNTTYNPNAVTLAAT